MRWWGQVGATGVGVVGVVDAAVVVDVEVVVDVLEVGQQLAVVGRLDVHGVADVRLALHRALDAGTGDLRVDLSRAEVRDATGLGVLLSVHRRALRSGRRLVLVDVAPALLRLLRAGRLDRVLVQVRSAEPAEPTDHALPA